MRSFALHLFLGSGLMHLAACQPSGSTTVEPPATCAKAGDSCTFAAGKLGLCIESADGKGTLICQSQH